jgi:hypothetical protein
MLNTNKEIACKKVLRDSVKAQIRDLGRYLNKLKYKWHRKIKDLKMAAT